MVDEVEVVVLVEVEAVFDVLPDESDEADVVDAAAEPLSDPVPFDAVSVLLDPPADAAAEEEPVFDAAGERESVL